MRRRADKKRSYQPFTDGDDGEVLVIDRNGLASNSGDSGAFPAPFERGVSAASLEEHQRETMPFIARPTSPDTEDEHESGGPVAGPNMLRRTKRSNSNTSRSSLQSAPGQEKEEPVPRDVRGSFTANLQRMEHRSFTCIDPEGDGGNTARSSIPTARAADGSGGSDMLAALLTAVEEIRRGNMQPQGPKHLHRRVAHHHHHLIHHLSHVPYRRARALAEYSQLRKKDRRQMDAGNFVYLTPEKRHRLVKALWRKGFYITFSRTMFESKFQTSSRLLSLSCLLFIYCVLLSCSCIRILELAN